MRRECNKQQGATIQQPNQQHAVLLRLFIPIYRFLNSEYYWPRKFSARPGERSSHKEATTQPGAKISL